MIKIRFDNVCDELIFFVRIKEMEDILGFKIRCAVLVKDKDLPDGSSDTNQVE